MRLPADAPKRRAEAHHRWSPVPVLPPWLARSGPDRTDLCGAAAECKLRPRASGAGRAASQQETTLRTLGPASSAVRTAGGSLPGSDKAISAALVSRRYPLTDRHPVSDRDRWAHPSRAAVRSGPGCRRGGPAGVPEAAGRVGRRVSRDGLFPPFRHPQSRG